MNSMPPLPEHSNCKNCGWCCCIVPITAREEQDIRQYVTRMPSSTRQHLAYQPRNHGECQFHDRDKQRCGIYPIRPKVCQMFGSVLSMNCPHGNSANLNIRHLLITQPLLLMPEYLGRRISRNHSIPLASLSSADDYFRKGSCLLAAAQVQYKFKNFNNLLQCSIDIDISKYHPTLKSQDARFLTTS